MREDIHIRLFVPNDLPALMQLFYETVHAIGKEYYSSQHLAAWAPEDSSIEKWKISFQNTLCYIAEIESVIVGFADMSEQGHIERLYTHKNFLGRGIASTLLSTLENEAKKRGLLSLSTDSSSIAFPFFKQRGFILIKEYEKTHNGVIFYNFLMRKNLV